MATRLERRKRAYARRKQRVRKKVRGTRARPRLVVSRSLRSMNAALVDDREGITLTGANARNLPEKGLELPENAEQYEVNGRKLSLRAKVADAYRLGLYVAQLAKAKGIDRVVFDRNGYRYHGRVRAVAEGARQGGLEF
ncbi:MAG: 50S ribosomal protein L18 [Calditrichaeota bacterium]|nr:50S ribosomal protein L18 [Calditrichota bacterium]